VTNGQSLREGDVYRDAQLALQDADAVTSVIEAFVAGERPLTGIELYYELERSTPLLEFHTFLREGSRNRDASGLQQTYGDHNRLLMLGLDKLVDGDLAWYRARTAGDHEVSDDELRACFRTLSERGVPREALVALWLGAALHDCGMLCGRGASVDVEDGTVVAQEILAKLCPPALRDLATFVLRHHDYIKALFLGEVPAALIADDLERLAPELRGTALLGLGLVQIAGAASLGQGRLDGFRMEIWERCSDGSALSAHTPLTRLARLLSAEAHAASPSTGDAAALLDRLTEEDGERTRHVLSSVALHGWQRFASELDRVERMLLLVELVQVLADVDADHAVLAGGPVAADCGARLCVSSSDVSLSGAAIAVLVSS
jgi:hypothetical protein